MRDIVTLRIDEHLGSGQVLATVQLDILLRYLAEQRVPKSKYAVDPAAVVRSSLEGGSWSITPRA